MNVIILAGGRGERLWPLTETCPKVLLPLIGRPVIGYLLDNISRVRDISSITIAIDSDQRKYFDEETELTEAAFAQGKAVIREHSVVRGTPKGPVTKLAEIIASEDARLSVNDNYLVVGGDNYFGFDLNEFCEFYLSGEGQPCIASQQLDTSVDVSLVGVPKLTESGDLEDFTEKPTGEYAFIRAAACYCFNRETLTLANEYLEENQADTLGSFIHWLFNKKNRIRSFLFKKPWFDTGTREGLLEAQENLLSHLPESEQSRMTTGNVLFEGPVVSKSMIEGPGRIGPFVYVGEDCRVEGSEIQESIVHSGCVLKNCKLVGCIVGADSRIQGSFTNTLMGENSHLMSNMQ